MLFKESIVASRASPRSPMECKSDIDSRVESPYLNAQSCIHIEKLEKALEYLGIYPSVDDKTKLRQMIHIDSDGMTLYGEFVEATKKVFNLDMNKSSFYLSTLATENLPPIIKKQSPNILSPKTRNKLFNKFHLNLNKNNFDENDLLLEIENLKQQLLEKDKCCRLAEEEILKVRQDAQAAIEEARNLRSKMHLAEQAQIAARGMEKDYAEVVRLLESEILEFKKEQEVPLENPAVQKRLALVGCQLKKAEESKKRYEVSTKKLLNFTEKVHEVFGLQCEIGRQGKTGDDSVWKIAEEARHIVKVVRGLLEEEPLPFGWDEVYTEEGVKYYVNHISQTTSWIHPLSQVQHSSIKEKNMNSSPPSDELNNNVNDLMYSKNIPS